jgi:hypothetical protein
MSQERLPTPARPRRLEDRHEPPPDGCLSRRGEYLSRPGPDRLHAALFRRAPSSCRRGSGTDRYLGQKIGAKSRSACLTGRVYSRRRTDIESPPEPFCRASSGRDSAPEGLLERARTGRIPQAGEPRHSIPRDFVDGRGAARARFLSCARGAFRRRNAASAARPRGPGRPRGGAQHPGGAGWRPEVQRAPRAARRSTTGSREAPSDDRAATEHESVRRDIVQGSSDVRGPS